MRNGPLVHRHAQVSRLACSSPTPLDRLASLAPLGGLRTFSRRTDVAKPDEREFEPRRINLGTRLPLNLRQYLSEQLGATARVEEDAIVALAPRSPELMMRDLARAIRRFSSERAHQAWTECSIPTERLEQEFVGTSTAPVVLCLKCGTISGVAGQHAVESCLPVDLSSALCAGVARFSTNAIHRAVENFRAARVAAELPHFDLDCYTTGRQVIFTWRPLPNEAPA